MGKKTVLFIEEPIYPPGGGQVSLSLILEYIDRVKFEPLLFTAGKDAANSYLPLWRHLSRLLQKNNVHIIYSNAGSSRASFIALLLARLKKIPFIWHVRVHDRAPLREDILGMLSSKIIVISEFVREKFSNPRILAKTIKIYNAVDTNTFKPEAKSGYLKEELGISNNRRIIGIFSRIHPRKGHKLFLDAAKIIAESLSDVMFLIVGGKEDDYFGFIKQYAQEIGVSEKVVMTGFRQDIPQLMNLCDLVMDTAIEPEGFGRTIVEAMACGKCVISTGMGGPREIIEHGVSGFICEPDKAALARQALEVLKDNDLRNTISGEAIKRVERHFSIGPHIQAIESVYEEVTQ